MSVCKGCGRESRGRHLKSPEINLVNLFIFFISVALIAKVCGL